MSDPTIKTEGTLYRALESFYQALEIFADLVAERLRPQFQLAPGVRPRLLSVEDAAVYLGRSVHSVRHLIAAKKLPVVKMDQRLFIDLVDLDRIISESKSSCG
jgi:hypothetical protein